MTATSGVPTVITDIMRSSIPSQIKFEAISVGSAPMPATLTAEFSEAFPGVPLLVLWLLSLYVTDFSPRPPVSSGTMRMD